VELHNLEMATLDAFFNKTERPVYVSTVEPQKCESSIHNEKNNTDAFRKRGRDSDSPAQTKRFKNKRQKSLDSNLNVSNHSASVVANASEIVSNCQSCNQVEVEDKSLICIPSSAVEISYEEFLSGKGITHVETCLCNLQDAHTDIKMSPLRALKDGGLEDEVSIKRLEKNESSTDEDECEGNLSNSEVMSKDIRSFFSKAEKLSAQPVSAATLMKIKVDVHCHQSPKRSMPSKSKCIEGHTKAGNDLARRQRAAIVITDEDLDIDVIDVSKSDDDLQIEYLEDNIVDSVTSESNAENHVFNSELENTPSMCSQVSLDAHDKRKTSAVECSSVSVETATPIEKIAGSVRKPSLRTAKLKEANDKVNVQALEEAVSCNEVVDCDHDTSQFNKDECLDEVIMVDEKKDEVECDDSSATLSSDASRCDVTLTIKSRKTKQVSYSKTSL